MGLANALGTLTNLSLLITNARGTIGVMAVANISGTVFVRGIGVLLGFFILFALSGCRKRAESHPIIPNQELWSALLSQYPMPVSVSPTGKHFLLKTRHAHDFEIFVVDRSSQKIIASDRSSDTQLSLTWRPDGKAIAFQESRGGNRQYSLFIFDLNLGKRRRLNTPVTDSAAPPLRWCPSGAKLAYFQTTGNREGRIIALDMKNRAPAFLLNSIAPDGDFSWSPDARQFAAVCAPNNGTIVVINLETSDRRSFAVGPGSKIRHLAWAPNGKSLLATARRPGDEFYQLFGIELDQSRVTQCATQRGDVSTPLWLPSGESFIYHLNQNANFLPYLVFQNGSPTRGLGFTSGVNQVQTVAPDGAFILSKSTMSSPSLYEIDLNSAGSELLYSPTSGIDPSAISPVVVHLKSKDGRSIPALVWLSTATASTNHFVLIEVHAGPRLQSTSEWDAAKQFLLRNGISILSVDYRGSSGYGIAFEEVTDQVGQIDDVVAACDYATDTLKSPRRGVVLLGLSYGSTLVLGASVKRDDLLGGIILTSLTATPKERADPPRATFRVFGFHGQNDLVLSPSGARVSIEQYCGSQSLVPPSGHWEVFPDEGHHFHRTLSWAKVYTAIMESFPGSITTH